MEIFDTLKNFQLSEASWIVYIAVAIAVIGLIISIAKKAFWIALVSIIVSALLGISNPIGFQDVRRDVTNVFGGAVDPLKGDDYSDVADEAFKKND